MRTYVIITLISITHIFVRFYYFCRTSARAQAPKFVSTSTRLRASASSSRTLDVPATRTTSTHSASARSTAVALSVSQIQMSIMWFLVGHISVYMHYTYICTV